MKAIFPGSFDPITNGHIDIIMRAAALFEKVYVAVGNNISKQYLIPFENRTTIVEKVFAHVTNVEVIAYNELTVSLCKKLNAPYLIRGLRNSSDFDYERSIAIMNKSLWEESETLFFNSKPELSGLSSTIVREIYKYNGDISEFVPKEALEWLKK